MLVKQCRATEAAGASAAHAASAHEQAQRSAAESRVMAEGMRSMRQEFNAAWVSMPFLIASCHT